MDPVLEDEPARRRAALARGAERAPEHAVEREIEVGVVHHDHRVLAAHLEREPLVHAAARLADDAARLGRAGERDRPARRDARRSARRRPRRAPCTSWITSGGSPASSMISTSTCPVCGTSSRRLEDARVSADAAPGNIFHVGMASGKLNGVMMPATPIGRRKLIAHLFGSSLGTVRPDELAAHRRRVVRGVDPFLHVAARLGERLAHLARHQVRDLVLPLRRAGRRRGAARRRAPAPACGARARSRACADATARSTSAASESGKRPMRSRVSAGIAVLEVLAGRRARPTAPAMKFWKVLVMVEMLHEATRRVASVLHCGHESAAWRGGAVAVRSASAPSTSSRGARRVRLRVADARQDLGRAEHQPPEHEQQRQHVRPRRAMPPRPHAAPHAAGDDAATAATR